MAEVKAATCSCFLWGTCKVIISSTVNKSFVTKMTEVIFLLVEA
jgi:hypothetical protein